MPGSARHAVSSAEPKQRSPRSNRTPGISTKGCKTLASFVAIHAPLSDPSQHGGPTMKRLELNDLVSLARYALREGLLPGTSGE